MNTPEHTPPRSDELVERLKAALTPAPAPLVADGDAKGTT